MNCMKFSKAFRPLRPAGLKPIKINMVVLGGLNDD